MTLHHEILANLYVWMLALAKPYFVVVMCWMTFAFMHPKGLP